MSSPLPPLRILRPATVDAAVAAWQEDESSRYLAGGTDLLVNLRRGLGAPPALIDLSGIAELEAFACDSRGARIGAGVRLARLASDPATGALYPALREAALAVAAPGHRNLATLGGNLCLDTRCIYYNQSEWWRRANGYCLKHGGSVCHVAPEGQRCHAAFSGDLAPVLLVLGAEIEIAGPTGRRRIALSALYHEEGRAHLTLAAGELITAVVIPATAARCAYAKERVRGSFDFPLAGVAVALSIDGARLTALQVAATGVSSWPVLVTGTAALIGRAIDDSLLAEVDKLVQKQVRPMRTTLTQSHYRRLAAAALARRLVAALGAAEGGKS